MPSFVLNFLLHSFNAVGGFHLQRDGLAGRCLDKDRMALALTLKAKHSVSAIRTPNNRFFIVILHDESLWCINGGTKGYPLAKNLFFRQGLKALFRLLDGLLDDACCHRVQIQLQNGCCDRRALLLRYVIEFQ